MALDVSCKTEVAEKMRGGACRPQLKLPYEFLIGILNRLLQTSVSKVSITLITNWARKLPACSATDCSLVAYTSRMCAFGGNSGVTYLHVFVSAVRSC